MEHVLHSHQEISKEDFSKWHNLIWLIHQMDLTWWALEFYCMHWRRCLTLQRAWCTTTRLGGVVPIEPPSEQCMLGGRHDSRPSRHSELFTVFNCLKGWGDDEERAEPSRTQQRSFIKVLLFVGGGVYCPLHQLHNSKHVKCKGKSMWSAQLP
jgi:hypothetical protein